MATMKDATISVPASAPRHLHKDPETNKALQQLADTTLDPLLQAVAQLQSQIATLQKAK